MPSLKEIYSKKDISYYSHTRPELLKFVPKNLGIALDVGCARGNFGSMLKELYECEVWGIEPDESASIIAKGVLDNVISANFDINVAIPNDKKFECIFFNDVLEHLAQPDDTLQLAMQFLATNGCIIASIPNIRYYPVILSLIRYKDFKYADAGVMDRTHLRFFTKKSMVRLFEESGYEVKIIEGINKHRYKFLSILNFLLFNKLEDMHFPQFAIVAIKK